MPEDGTYTNIPGLFSPTFAEAARQKGGKLFLARRERQFRVTNRLFAALMVLQWFAAAGLAAWVSPWVWEGTDSREHLRFALAVGGILAVIPVVFTLLLPTAPVTRYSVAIAQVFMSALLVHLTGGRVETNVHLFAALALLTLYRDWKVIVLAAGLACVDHFVRGLMWPQSVYGTVDVHAWRWLEHVTWLILEAGVLVMVCRSSVSEMRDFAERCAALELSNHSIEATVCERTDALRKSETRLTQVVDSAMDAVIAIDSQGLVEVWNQQAHRIFGWTRGEAVGQPLRELVIPAGFRDDFSRGMARFQVTGQSRVLNRRLEAVGLHRDGHEFPIELSIAAIGSGQSLAFSAFVRDISERRRAQEALSERARLADLVADVGVALADSHDLRSMLERCCESVVKHLGVLASAVWTFNFANDTLQLKACAGFCREIGENGASIPLGYTEIGRVAVSRRAFITNLVDPALAANVREQFGLEEISAYAAYPLVLDGRLVGVIALFARKPFAEATIRELNAIADTIALGVVRKQAERQLRQAHIENKQLVESISSILITLDARGAITKWNRSAEAAFGISAREAAGRSILDCGIRWQDPAGVARCIEAPPAADYWVKRFEWIYFDERDEHRFLDLTVTRIENDDSKDEGLLLLAADVTAQKLLQAQLAQSQKLESIGQLAAGIAHEINTPIQYVGDNTQFLQAAFGELGSLLAAYELLYQSARDGELPPALLDTIEIAREKADIDYLNHHIPKAVSYSLEGLDRVANIVRAMKEFSHPGSEEKILADINRAIESTLTVTRNEWKYVADLELDLDPQLPGVPCLPGEFNQVLVNLIVNAAHAIADARAQSPEAKGCIRISTRHDDEWMELRIQDSGCGIPADIRHRVFDPFFTTKPVGKGTGQGLSLARNIVVTRHGGWIDFETEMNVGTTFIIRLPMNDVVQEPRGLTNEPASCVCR